MVLQRHSQCLVADGRHRHGSDRRRYAPPERQPGHAGRDRLTDAALDMLRMEERWWRYAGAKETAIWDQLNMSATRYYQLLSALIDQPEALAAAPVTVSRLRRLRDQRRAQRTSAGRPDRLDPGETGD